MPRRSLMWYVLLVAPTLLVLSCAAAEARGPASESSVVSVTLAAPIGPAVSAAAPKLCEGENCWALGVKATDKAQSEAFYRAGCEQDHPRSCDFLAQMLDRPGCNGSFCLSDEGVEIARKGCRLGAKSSCFYIAETLKETGRKDELESLYASGCEDESFIIQSYSCRAAMDLAFARGDFTNAARHAKRICEVKVSSSGEPDEGHNGGCTLYGWLLATGQGVPKDESEGTKLLLLMCVLDAPGACDRVKELERLKK